MMLLIVSLAHAEEPTGEQMFKNGTTTGTVGAVAGLTGFGVWTSGVVLNQPVVSLVGSVPATAGAPFLAGGSLRANHGLEEMGIDASSTLGTVSWACWATSLGTGLVSAVAGETSATAPLALASNGLLLASYGMGIGQNAVNRGAYNRAMARRAPESEEATRPAAPPSPRFSAAPFVAGGRAGLVLTGSF